MKRFVVMALVLSLILIPTLVYAENECPTGTTKYFRTWVEETAVAGQSVCFQLWATEPLFLLDVTVSTNTQLWYVIGYSEKRLPRSIVDTGAASASGITFTGGRSKAGTVRVTKGPVAKLADGDCLLGQMRSQGTHVYDPQMTVFNAPIGAGRGVVVRTDRPAMVAVSYTWCE